MNNILELAERRACPRLNTTSLIFVRLDNRNGGIAFNISENGLALSATREVPHGSISQLGIQFPESPEWIVASAQVVWRSDSKKEAGVRFVYLSEQGREKIRDWISTQAPLRESLAQTELEASADPPDLKTDGTEERSPGDLVAINPAVRRRLFIDGEPGHDERQERRTAIERKAGSVSSPAGERRAHARTRIIPLGYLQLGEANGGIALNVSEGGLAITAAVILGDDHLPNIRFLFPDCTEWVEASGRIVWRSESRKEAGVQFVGLRKEALRQIRNWAATAAAPNRLAERSDPLHEKWPLPEPQQTPRLRDLFGGALARKAKAENQAAGELLLRPLVVASMSQIEDSLERAPNDTVIRDGTGGWLPFFISQLHDDRRKVVLTAAMVALIFLLPISLLLRRDLKNGVAAPTREPRFAQELASRGLAQSQVPANPQLPDPPKGSASPHDNREEARYADGNNQEAHDPLPANLRTHIPVIVQGTKRTDPQFVPGNTSGTSEVPRQPRPALNLTDSRPIVKTQSLTESSPPAVLGPPDTNMGTLVDVRPSPPKAPGMAGNLKTGANLEGKIEVVADPYPSLRIQEGHKKTKSAKGSAIQLGHLVTRVEPTYPAEARQQGIEGTVKMHAVIARDGSVRRLDTVSGHPILASAAMSAIRQWRYTQSSLAGRAVETEEDISVTFRLSH